MNACLTGTSIFANADQILKLIRVYVLYKTMQAIMRELIYVLLITDFKELKHGVCSLWKYIFLISF